MSSEKILVELTQHTFHVQNMIPKLPESNRELEIFQQLYDAIGMRLTAKIFGETLDVEEYPTTWWDAFKVRWYPNWILRKFPAKITRLEAVALYPFISLPNKHSKTIFLRKAFIYPLHEAILEGGEMLPEA